MKIIRLLSMLLAIICSVSVITVNVSAQDEENEDLDFALTDTQPLYSELPHIIDNADVLSDSFEDALLDDIMNIRNECGADIVLIFTEGTGAAYEHQLADILIEYYNYIGYGDGIAIMVDVDERLYFINYFGENKDNGTENKIYIGNDSRCFDYDTRLYIDDRVQPRLHDDNFEGAAKELVSLSGKYLKTGHMPLEAMEIVISIAIGLLIALFVTVILKKKMKPVAIATNANEYLVRETFNMRTMIPIFIRSSVTRTRRNNDSSSGGGSSHSGSHGTGTGGRF